MKAGVCQECKQPLLSNSNDIAQFKESFFRKSASAAFDERG